MLHGQRNRPEGISIKLENTVNSGRNRVDSVLSVVKEPNLSCGGNGISGLVYSSLSGLTEHDGLVRKLRIANISSHPLVNGVIYQVLQTGYQVGSGLMGRVVLVLVNVGNQVGAGIGQSHPLEAIVLAVGSGSGANQSTTGSIELGVSGWGDQITLLLNAIERSSDGLSVVLRDTLQSNATADNILNVVGILHEHGVASNREDFGDDRHAAIKGCCSDRDVAILGVAGRIQIVEKSSAANIHRAANSRIRFDSFGYGSRDCGRNLAVVGFVTSNVSYGNNYGNTQPLAISGVASGAVTSHQFLTINGHLHIHFVAGLQRRGQRGAVDLSASGEELDLNDLIGSSNTNHAKIASYSVLEKLVNAVVAEERDALSRNSGSSNANQFFIVIQRRDCDWSVEGETSYRYVFLSLHQHVDSAEVCNSAKSNLARLLVNIHTGSPRGYTTGPERESCHVFIGRILPFRLPVMAKAIPSWCP